MMKQDDITRKARSRAHGMPESPGARVALYGMLAALALCAGYLEVLVPLPVTVPGVKLGLGNAVVRRFHKRPIDVVYTGKIATALLMSGFSLMLLGLPVVDGIDLLGAGASAFPGLNGAPVPLGIFFVYGGVAFSMITAVVYTVKGAAAIRRARQHPEEEDVDFLNPEIEDSDDDTPARDAAAGVE